MNFDLNDDKNLVVLCVTLILLVGMFALQEPAQIVSNGIAGLFGVAVGKTLR